MIAKCKGVNGKIGNLANSAQQINTYNDYSTLFATISQTIIQNTRIGGDVGYLISGNPGAVKVVATGFKITPFLGLGITISTGTYLSLSINPETNQPYQSWAETGIDITATSSSILIATKFGGWYGAAAAAIYIAGKASLKFYINTIKNHPDWVLPPSVHSFKH